VSITLFFRIFTKSIVVLLTEPHRMKPALKVFIKQTHVDGHP